MSNNKKVKDKEFDVGDEVTIIYSLQFRDDESQNYIGIKGIVASHDKLVTEHLRDIVYQVDFEDNEDISCQAAEMILWSSLPKIDEIVFNIEKLEKKL